MAAQRGCARGFKSLIHCHPQHSNTRIVTLYTAQPHIDCRSEGGNGEYCKKALTNVPVLAILPTINAMTGTSSTVVSCAESPWLGGKGRGKRREYLPEQRTETSLAVGSAGRARYSAGVLLGTSRGRVPRGGGEPEVVPRYFALCPNNPAKLCGRAGRGCLCFS